MLIYSALKLHKTPLDGVFPPYEFKHTEQCVYIIKGEKTTLGFCCEIISTITYIPAFEYK